MITKTFRVVFLCLACGLLLPFAEPAWSSSPAPVRTSLNAGVDPCQPEPMGMFCIGDCTDPGLQCVPTEVTKDADGNPRITQCECIDECHVDLDPDTSLVRCVNLCPDPTIPCELKSEMVGGVLVHTCVCEPATCLEPAGQTICADLQDQQCLSDDPSLNCLPLCVEMVDDGTGVPVPVAAECSCISPDDLSCGPLHIEPVPGTPFFDFICQAECLPPEAGTCQVIVGGVATGQGKISSEMVPPGSQVCCDCVELPPPTCPEPAGQTICSDLEDEQCLSSDPDTICEPLCVTIEGVGGVFTPVAKLCDCIADDNCGPVDVTPIGPNPPADYELSCEGLCDAGEICEVFIDGHATGQTSINASAVAVGSQVCCDCAPDPPPNVCPLPPGDILCEDRQAIDCPEDQTGEFCQASCVDYDPLNGMVTASQCDCQAEGDCHVIIGPAGPICDGTCADGTPCEPTTKENSDGTIRFCCGCCPSSDLNLNLTTGVDDNTGGLIAIGANDDTWMVTCEPPSGLPLPRPARVIAKHPAWAILPGSRWISANTSGPNGEYCYETCFCLDERARNPNLTLQLLADDQAFVFVNGFFIGQTPSPGFLAPTLLMTNDETLFLPGQTNCITVVVENQYGVVTGFDLQGSLTVENGQCCCGPTDDGSACEDVDCPVDTEECQPRCAAIDPLTQEVTVEGCECREEGSCHPVVMPGADPECVGGCPDGEECVETLIHDDNTGVVIGICCDCEPVPQVCVPTPICQPLLDEDCQSDDPTLNCRPLCVEMVDDGAGGLVPVAAECSCISPDDQSCGPLRMQQEPGTDNFDFICEGECPAPDVGECQVMIDGLATGQSQISSKQVPAGSQVCCECVDFPPPTCPEPAGQTICSDLDEQCLSSAPNTTCEPLCVTIEGVGGVFTPVAVLCDCIADDNCGPVDVTPINDPPSDYELSCQGLCAEDEICEVFIDGHATGQVSVNASAVAVGSQVCCDCADDPPLELCPLPPNETLCADRQAIDCTEDQTGEFCQARCVNIDPLTGMVTASECDCQAAGDCRVIIDAAGQPICGGTCADGTPCEPSTKDNADGTISFCCGCCPTSDLNLNLTTGVDDGTGALIAIGANDDTWMVTCEPPSGLPLPRPARVIAKHPAWAILPGSRWISANTSGPNGEYCYETCFCLDERARNPILTLELLADDQAFVFVNSLFLGQTPSPGFLAPTLLTTNDETFFLPGETNCITVVVENQFGVVTGFNLVGSLTVENGECCCGPTDDGSACKDVDCPMDTEECQPRCVSIDPLTQEVTVEDCECREEDECHPLVVPGADPECVGGCPDGEECVETPIHDPNTGVVIGICCDCEAKPVIGACCDHAQPGGACIDGLTEAECLNDPTLLQPEWFAGMTCVDVEAAGLCEEHTGACCDHSQPGGSCIDGVPESQCLPGGGGGGNVIWTMDPAEFNDLVMQVGKVLKGIETFEESNIPDGGKQFLTDPLMGGVPNVNPSTGWGFPTGLDAMNLSIQANLNPGPSAPAAPPTGNTLALFVAGAGFINSNSKKIGEDLFLKGLAASIDLIFTEPNKTAVGFELSRFQGWGTGAGWIIAAFDKNENLIGKFTIPGPVPFEPAKTFVGVVSTQTIGRINIFDLEPDPRPEAIDNIQMWVGDPPPPDDSQLEWFKDLTCTEIECLEHTGACCDGTTGICNDGVPESECPVDPTDPDNQFRWEKGVFCDQMVPPCTEHTGACCDGTTGVCTDGVPESQCVNGGPDDQFTWYKDTACIDPIVVCTEHTGACCDGTTGQCQDNVPESQCACSETACPCDCDINTDGICNILDLTILMSCIGQPPTGSCAGADINCDGVITVADLEAVECLESGLPPKVCCAGTGQCRWEKDTQCIDLVPPCTEHTGACCDGTTGNCDDGVPESECPTGCFGECVNGSYCDDPDCCIEPGNCMCYSPNSQISIELCGDCFGECINGSYCDHPDPNCCVGDACQCFSPNHPVSIKLCGECFGECVNGSYCDPTDNDECCVEPGNCMCYMPDHAISIKLCGDLPDPNNQYRWEKDTPCSALDPPCEEHTGACCDHAQSGGVCVDDVPESQCIGGGTGEYKEYKIPADQTIPDGDPAGVRHEFFVPDHGIIADLNVDLLIQHTKRSDLTIWLQKKSDDGAGVTVILSSNPDGDSDNIGNPSTGEKVILDDESPVLFDSVPGDNPVGHYQPSQPLSEFDGFDKFGTWSITVVDNFDGETGIFIQWSLNMVNDGQDGQTEWFKDETCADVEAAGLCGEHTGACCDGTTGDCADDVPESECPTAEIPPGIGTCEDEEQCSTPCPAIGACMTDSDCGPGGTCLPGCVSSFCSCDENGNWICTDDCNGLCAAVPNQNRWEKDTLCSELEPPCQEHTGACCDGTTGNCDDGVPESECPVGCFGECIEGAYCDDPDCCVDPDNCPVCYEPNDQISIELCGDCFGECINGSYCDPPDPNCCINPAACQCYMPSHPVSLSLCGDCFGECVNGGYCDSPADPDCCIQPGNCICYGPEHPVSIKLCGDLPDPDNQYRWEKDTACADLDPPCEEHTGACCDEGNTGECLDGVRESECQFERWEKDVSCDELDPPCEGGICNPDCIRDIDGDGHVNAFDLAVLLGCWGQILPGTACECFDKDGDGFITAFDLASLLGAWGPCP